MVITSSPKISVIVPVYNVEDYLAKCLQSLVDQDLQEIEIIVVNDGSQDNSKIIIKDFATRYPNKIKALEKDNGGLSDARNIGIDNAVGDYLAFVDSDDYVSKDMFLDMYDLAIKHSAEMVICNLQKVNEDGVVTQYMPQIPNMPEKIILKDHFSVFSDLSYFACNKIFEKRLFQSHRFRKGMHFEDIELIPKLLLDCKIIACTKKYHYNYLERSNSISKTHTIKGLDILKAVKSVEGYFVNSQYNSYMAELKNFQILEGVYTYLAYLAFVKDDVVYCQMSNDLKLFIKKRELLVSEIVKYKRFGKNYMLSLPLKKKIYYLLYFLNLENWIRKLIK